MLHKKLTFMKSDWRILFIISTAALFVALLADIRILYLASKPLLMVSLALYFVSASRGYPRWRLYVIIALVFSWAGDVFLISSDMFVAGLVSFLLAHIFYIIAYQKTGAANGELRPLDIMKFVLFGSVLMWVLYPQLGDMLIPVLAYALVLMTMGVWAHKRRGATSAASFMLVSTGTILFVISDSLIAINKFAIKIPGEQLLVMSTYITAQYMIVRGLLRHEGA